jgi:hypothetical protein
MSDPTLTHDSLPSAHVLHAAVVAFANTDTWNSELVLDFRLVVVPKASKQSSQSKIFVYYYSLSCRDLFCRGHT